MQRGGIEAQASQRRVGRAAEALQNFVQARVLKPRRRLGLCYFDTAAASGDCRALPQGIIGGLDELPHQVCRRSRAVTRFETHTPAIVRLRASAWKGDPPVEIRIPLGALAAELRRRLPLADVARDLPPGRKRLGWKRDFLASVREAAVELKGVSDRQITDAVHAYRRDRVKSVLTVVAEAASQPA